MTDQDMQKFFNQFLMTEQQTKIKRFQQLNKLARKGQILFTGSSLMEQFPVGELSLFHNLDKIIYNRGIGGFTTDNFIKVIDTVLFDINPSKVFINIGTNDMKSWPDDQEWLPRLTANLKLIFQQCAEKLPDTEFFLMAYYPVNAKSSSEMAAIFNIRNNPNIALINEQIQKIASSFHYNYIDCNQGLTDNKGNLKSEFTFDGIHMYPQAYQIIFSNLLQYL